MDRSLTVVVNGHPSSSYYIGASVPQGSVLRPILWNSYISDLLQFLPSSFANADGCTLSQSFASGDINTVAENTNEALQNIAAWSRRRQVTFAKEKHSP